MPSTRRRTRTNERPSPPRRLHNGKMPMWLQSMAHQNPRGWGEAAEAGRRAGGRAGQGGPWRWSVGGCGLSGQETHSDGVAYLDAPSRLVLVWPTPAVWDARVAKDKLPVARSGRHVAGHQASEPRPPGKGGTARSFVFSVVIGFPKRRKTRPKK